MPFTETDEEAMEPAGHKHTDECGCESKTLVALGEEGDKPSRKPMRFVSLHHHTTFSWLDGYAMPEEHVARAAELNMQALAVTEHGNVSSHVKLEMATSKTGVKPIYGCELYTGGTEEGTKTQRKNHLTVLAENAEGYKNLLRVVTKGWQDYYYEPTVSGRVLRQNAEGLVVLSGCTGSLLATSLIGGKNVERGDASYARGREVARRFKRTFRDSYYLEVQAFPELASVRELNGMLVRLSDELDIPLVATCDIHYTRPEESLVQQILHNIRGGSRQTLEQQAQSWGYDVPLSPPLTDKQVMKRLIATGLTRQQAINAILATEEIAQRCTVDLPKMEMLRFPTPPGFESSQQVWEQWLRDGWEYRGVSQMSKAERRRYRAQLQYEMKIIEDKDFIDYFLVISDIIKFAKDRGIPIGPARGSAAASIVCWLLRITEVNPMLFSNLVFERFIDVSRQDLPDIDLDFDSERRWEIMDYAIQKYGKECVGKIGTFTMFKSKNSLDDVARVYRIPQFEVDAVKDLLVERSSGDLRASETIADTVENFERAKEIFDKYPDLARAMELEGNVKGLGVHASGLIIASRPIAEVCAVYRREVKGEIVDVIGLDKWDVERQGLLKLDALGLNTMTVLRHALEITGMNLDDLYKISLEDDEVIQGFREADVVGIFQFDGRATRNVTAELRPDSFKEVADICALARPGPLHNGATSEYIEIKHGKKEPSRFHPLLDVITEDTHYQIVYQEQILRIVREIGDFDWTAAAHIRKIISKKLGEQEFQRQFDSFWAGASTKEGMTLEMAKNIWNRCITAGSYAFNAAHSVSYGMLAWWTMWFKRHHPEAFYVSSLRYMNDEKHLELLRDAHKRGIKALPPHHARSSESWKVVSKGKIRGGFSQVSGVGMKLAPKFQEFKIEEAEAGRPITQWSDYQRMKGIGPAKIKAFEKMQKSDDPYGIFWLERRIKATRGDLLGLGLPPASHSGSEIPYSKGNDVRLVWVGQVISRNLRDIFELHYSRTGEELDRADTKDPDKNEFVTMWCQDHEELVVVTVDRWKYPRFRKMIWGIDMKKDLIVVHGIKRGNQARRAIYVENMWVLTPEDEEDE